MPYSSIGKMKGKTTISSPDIDCQQQQQQQQQQREIEIIISHCIEKHIRQLHHPYHICPKRRLVIAASVRCNHKPGNGKPHDVETRIPLTLFHQWKRDLIVNRNKSNINKTTEDVNESIIATAACTASEQVALKQTNAYPSSPSSSSSSSLPVVTITSDLGLNREIHSPQQLANLLAPLLEEDFRNNPEWEMSPDVRSSPSGILSMITKKRALMLYNTGRLPCPYCIQWCNGTKVNTTRDSIHKLLICHLYLFPQPFHVAHLCITIEYRDYGGISNNIILSNIRRRQLSLTLPLLVPMLL